MAPKGNHSKIEAFKRKPIDKRSDTEHSVDEQTQLSGSLENLIVRKDLEAGVP